MFCGINAEPDLVFYMSAYLLLDPFQLYLEMPVVFGLSIYTATGNSCTVGDENVLVGYFLGGGGNFTKHLVLLVIAEKMKICCLHVSNNPYTQDVS